MIQFILRHVNYSARFSPENGPRMRLKSALTGVRFRNARLSSNPKNLPFRQVLSLQDIFSGKLGTEGPFSNLSDWHQGMIQKVLSRK
jgi:hypothetical protein